MFIANMGPGCYVPLILSSPATYLWHTWQRQPRSGQTLSQRCSCVGCFHRLSLQSHLALCIILLKAFATLCLRHTIHCYHLGFQSPSRATPVPPITPSPLTGHCGVNRHLQPAPQVGLHYTFFSSLKGTRVLSPVTPHRDTILTLCNIMADVSFFTLLFSHS